MYQQLVQPNLNIVGQDGLCLVYVREVFGAPAEYPTASVAWQNTSYPHAGEQPPSTLAVPIWFSWETDGHVAVWDNGTVYSTTAQGDKTFPSIQALMDYIQEGIAYLGWSEDINSERVVEPQEEAMPNEGDVINIFELQDGRQPTAAEIAAYTTLGWSAPTGIFYGKVYPYIKGLQTDLTNAQNASYTPVTEQLYTKN